MGSIILYSRVSSLCRAPSFYRSSVRRMLLYVIAGLCASAQVLAQNSGYHTSYDNRFTNDADYGFIAEYVVSNDGYNTPQHTSQHTPQHTSQQHTVQHTPQHTSQQHTVQH